MRYFPGGYLRIFLAGRQIIAAHKIAALFVDYKKSGRQVLSKELLPVWNIKLFNESSSVTVNCYSATAGAESAEEEAGNPEEEAGNPEEEAENPEEDEAQEAEG